MNTNTPPSSPQSVTVALTQMVCSANPDANLSRQSALIRQAAAQGAQIVCTPELFRSQYFCQTEDHRFFQLAEQIPGPTTAAIANLAHQLNIVIVASLFERRAQGLYHNTAVVFDTSGKLAGIYRKMHIPDDPLYYEKFYFTPGDTGFRAFDTAFGKIGVLVCWDQWFPEAARLTALHGAQILFYPSAIGWHPSEKAQFGTRQHDAWELIQRSHAIANGCFVCSVNRAGLETTASSHGIEFWGQSFVASPDGQVLARASTDRDEVLLAQCDLRLLEFTRTHWPFFRDRRVDAYAPLTKRFID